MARGTAEGISSAGLPVAFLLSANESSTLSRSASRWLKAVGQRTVHPLSWRRPPAKDKDHPIWVAAEFRRLSGLMEVHGNGFGTWSGLRNAVAFFDLSGDCGLLPDFEAAWNQANLLRAHRDPGLSLICMLILAFPEVHWVLGPEGPQDPLERLRRLAPRLRHQAAPLFDPDEWREHIKEGLREGDTDTNVPEVSHLPIRKDTAVVIDEEPDYAFFNGYVAYRFFSRVSTVTTLEVGRMFLGCSEPTPGHSIEDLYLNFPDRPADVHLSLLEKRDACFPKLKDVAIRVFVTSGARSREEDRTNRRYLKKYGKRFKKIAKPTRGVLNLRDEAGLGRHKSVWPPQPKRGAGATASHSAPGRMFSIAQVLLDRSKKVLESDRSVLGAIHAATLALDAKEMLGCLTPTKALEAVQVQHEAEVTAESLFLGTEYNLQLKDRFRELEEEVAAVFERGRLPRGKAGKATARSGKNARLTILGRLAQRFRDLHQIEEEMACLAEARRLRMELWVSESPLRRLAWPLLVFVNQGLRSIPRFGVSLAAWVLLFGGLYAVLGVLAQRAPTPGFFLESLSAAAGFFFTLQSSYGWDRLVEDPHSTLNMVWSWVLAFQGLASFLNLGLFLSHVFQIVSRR